MFYFRIFSSKLNFLEATCSIIHLKILSILNMCLIVASFSGCRAAGKFVIFHYVKVAKLIWDPCCLLAT